MSIVATEIEAVFGTTQRTIYYRCQDDQGQWHSYGPVITTDQGWDEEAFKSTVAAKVAERLAAAEAEQVLDS